MIYKFGAEPLAVFVSVLLFINTRLQVKPTTKILKRRDSLQLLKLV